MDSTELKYPKMSIGRAEDLTNKVFGKWKVLYRTLNDNSGKAMWVCECSCEKHTIKPVSARTLKNNTSTNCGCERVKTLSNRADNKIHIRNEKGDIISKKCFRCHQWLPLDNFWKNRTQKDGYSGECKECQNTAKENRYNFYKKGAKKRNIDFNLTKDEFYNLTSKKCYYCNEIKEYNGIDRIDSSRGYTLKNCVPCCEYCNKMKLDYTIDFWVNHMKKILNNWEGKK